MKFLSPLILMLFSFQLIAQDAENITYSACANACVEIGLETDFCFSWFDDEGNMLDIQVSKRDICPTERHSSVLKIFDNDGNNERLINYVVNVVDQGNPQSIVEYFLDKGFQPIPYFAILPPGIVSPDDGDIAVEKSLCNNVINHAASTGVSVLNSQTFEVDVPEEDLERMLSESYCGIDATLYLTDNLNFCAGNEVSEIEAKFNNSDELVVWWHIIDMSNDPRGIPDILVVASNETLISGRNRSQRQDIEFPNWDIFPIQNNPALPSYSYTVMHRTFAPWVDFGSLSVGPAPYRLTENDYEGDDRGFSLADHTPITGGIGGLVSSRGMQECSFILNQDGLTSANRISSVTKGHFLFLQPPATNVMEWIGIKELIEQITGSSLADEPCDFDNACVTNPVRNPGQERYENNTLFIASEAINKCVPLAAPPLLLKSKLTFDIEFFEGKRFLSVMGIAMNKSYPAREMYIEDPSGRKMFLYTGGPPGEGSIFVELAPPLYDEVKILNFMVEIDENGNFLNEVRRLRSPGFASFSDYPFTFKSISKINHSTPNFVTDVLNFDSWNDLNLGAAPAEDWIIDRCGEFGCCTP